MRYQVGKAARVFVCRLEDGEDMLKVLTDLAVTENVKAAVFHVVGGMRDGAIVVGPETEDMPPKPVFRRINESHEVTGMGTIFPGDSGPRIHFHGAFGKKDSVIIGCLREFSETFLILEVIVTEIEGIDAVREYDPLTAFHLLKL